MDQIAKFLFDQLGKPVIVDKEVAQIKVTLINPQPLPPDEARYILNTALHEAGVAVEERERTVHLIPIANVARSQIRTLGADEDLSEWKPENEIVRKIFEVKHYDAARLIDVLKPLSPPYGHITADPATGRLIAVASVERLLIMSRIITELDRPDVSGGELRVFPLRHVDVYEVIPMLEKLIAGFLGVEVSAVTVTEAAPPRPPGPAGMPGGPPGAGPPGPPDGAARPDAAAGTAVAVRPARTPVLLIPEPRRGELVVQAPTNVLAQVELWLQTLDQPKPATTQMEIIEIAYGDAGDMASQLTSLLNNIPDEGLRTGVRIFPFTVSRRIMIVGSEQNRGLVKEWLGELDVADSGVRITQTFTLQNADAQQVAENIKELFQEQTRRTYYYFGSPRAEPERDKVTVTANVRNNSVTVVASPEKMARIAEQIDEWDRPFEGEEAAPRIFNLVYADPEKTKVLLDSLFTKKEQAFTWRRFWDDELESTPSPVGRLFGQFRFEAYPELGKLVVISKNERNYRVIEEMLREIDRPQDTGRPRLIQLKFAEAETLAEQLNALLSGPGTPASILRRARSGTFEGFSELRSPYRQSQQPQQQQRQPGSPDQQAELATMRFWWQQPMQDTKVRQPSNMVGKLRIVPNVEQNLLMVAAPEEHADAIEQFVHELDKPGYQVLIKAVIAEIVHDDATSLGYRFSTDPTAFITGDPLITENALRGLLSYQFEDTFGRQHQLAFNIDVNNLLSLLRRTTDLRIRSEPKILTADNIEGEFFDGQDIPFIASSRLTEFGQRDETFDYFPVGIRLRVRPHITKDRNIDLTINLLVSSVIPGRTLFGGAIVDRRETTTRIVLEDQRTFLISGILREEERSIVRRIPGLGDIPVIGELFKHRELAKVNTELLVFLTPYVVGPDLPYDPIESEPLRRLRDHLVPEGEFHGAQSDAAPHRSDR